MLLVAENGHVVEVDKKEQIFSLKNQGWREATPAETERYRLKVAQAVAKAKTPRKSSENSVYYQTIKPSSDGYGMSRDIIKQELFRQKIKLDEDYSNQKVGLLYNYPNGVIQMRTDVRLIYTMFESDSIPEDWPEYLKAADEVLVPSKWCHDVFLKAGIQSTVVPLGFNARAFGYIDRPVPVEHDEVFTFIHYDSFNVRKGFSEVFKAFTEEFKHNEPARLILKTIKNKPPIPIIKSEYPNIEVIAADLSEDQLAALLGRAHCMVYPSRGEGFGITPLEAMASGIPAIVPNAHGISEYFNAQYMLEVKVSGSSPGLYVRFRKQDVGEMVICDVEDLRKKMRYAFNHQQEMKELGRSASEYARFYTYERTATQLAEIIRRWQNTDVVKRQDSKYLKVEKV